jgi:hypothetical protein
VPRFYSINVWTLITSTEDIVEYDVERYTDYLLVEECVDGGLEGLWMI